MDRWRDGVARQRRTSLDMKSRQRKVSHAHRHVPARGQQAVGEERRLESYFPTGFPPTCRSVLCASEFEVSGRRRAGRKSHRRQGDLTVAATKVRRSDGGGFRKENKVTGRKHDHRKSKLGFPTWL